MDMLKRMLSTHSDCFYNEYKGRLTGDVRLRDDGEVSIVICMGCGIGTLAE